MIWMRVTVGAPAFGACAPDPQPRSVPMRLTLLVALAVVVSSAPIGGLAQVALPRAPGARVVTVSPFGREEPGIAVNPRSPNQVIAVFQGPAEAAYSQDSARSFAASAGTAAPEWRRTGDVSVTFDNQGRAYLCYIAFDLQGTTYYWGHGGGRNGVIVRRSVDGGKTWEPGGAAVRIPPLQSNTPFQDMARIFADNGPQSPNAGHLYVGWIEWQLTRSIMLFSRSTDGGRTWDPAVRISTHAGLPRDGNGDVVGFNGTVGPDGTVYTVWHDGAHIAFATSRDGGHSFAASRWIIETGPPYMGAIPGLGPIFGAMGFPQIGVDPHAGTLYVTWSDYRNGDIDVFLSRSADQGRTWTSPLRVNDDPVHDGSDQFFQWMAVDPVTGGVYVQFYDRREDPADRKTKVTLARSTDGGRTFTNYAWTDAAFDGHDVRLGDYMWLTAYDNRVYGAWAEPVAADSGVAAAGAPRRYGPVIRVGTADFSGPR
jgi:hypothetical protein